MKSCSICFCSYEEIKMLKWMRLSPVPLFICMDCFHKCYLSPKTRPKEYDESIKGVWDVTYSSICLYAEETDRED